jgi:hypothetical protein
MRKKPDTYEKVNETVGKREAAVIVSCSLLKAATIDVSRRSNPSFRVCELMQSGIFESR